jgi:hypothetical protein
VRSTAWHSTACRVIARLQAQLQNHSVQAMPSEGCVRQPKPAGLQLHPLDGHVCEQECPGALYPESALLLLLLLLLLQ